MIAMLPPAFEPLAAAMAEPAMLMSRPDRMTVPPALGIPASIDVPFADTVAPMDSCVEAVNDTEPPCAEPLADTLPPWAVPFAAILPVPATRTSLPVTTIEPPAPAGVGNEPDVVEPCETTWPPPF